ncbi:MAG: metal ABC transporter ATP-binding protein [Candidatus Colwellbacteria bacterium]|nr:metal ABC transporter ATP-binding protein [Candidatus Colwellbacteria bacterium]
MTKILEVENLNVAFNGVRVLEDLNFSVEDGDALTIIGPNGSGKTVLLKTLLNLIPYQGKITWKKDIKTGYLPQTLFLDQSLPLTLREFLMSKINVTKTDPNDLEETLKLVRLPEDSLNHSLGRLSGGQIQRALVAFALIGNPDVLLLDEPTASIDPPGEEQIYDTIHNLQDMKKLTVIIVSHDLSLVYRYATKVLCLNKQQICFGPPEETLTTKKLEELYGAPHKFYHHLHDGSTH